MQVFAVVAIAVVVVVKLVRSRCGLDDSKASYFMPCVFHRLFAGSLESH